MACSGEPRAGNGGEAAASPPPVTMPAPTGPIDPALVAQGEQLFTTKACVGCHTIGQGKLTGPDLQGITERRAFGWTMAMITNPDSMLRNDEQARALLREYMTPMTNMAVTADEARAIYEFLRR